MGRRLTHRGKAGPRDEPETEESSPGEWQAASQASQQRPLPHPARRPTRCLRELAERTRAAPGAPLLPV
jgi:hypothetical protein